VCVMIHAVRILIRDDKPHPVLGRNIEMRHTYQQTTR